MMFSLQKDKASDIWLGRFSLFPAPFVTAAVTARWGGVSGGAYRSLNLGLHVGDDVKAVAENRRRACRALNLDFSRLINAEQVHSANVAVVDAADAGRGNDDYAKAVPATDGLVTNVPGLPLLLCFADCTPLFFFDPVKRVAAVTHAGWRGTMDKIGAATVRVMRERFDCDPADILAAIGPSIGVQDYEVGEDLEREFRAKWQDAAAKIFTKPCGENGKSHLDMWLANRLTLEAAGIPSENIETAGVSTQSFSEMFYSFRQDDGVTGRFGAIISLNG